ncbi:MAG: TlpA family protein disulfide reductase [Planctomycetaceae bacterium]|jgi:thiol-disulfide isomerase/thioredoxin|nr:TlpA family protein disulfide reductase [Planctomycetaceae bacterium]
MTLARFFLFFLFFVSLSCYAAETQWEPENVPAQNIDVFLFYYQHFLHANPFPIERKPKNEEEKLKNIIHHQQLSFLYNKLSEVAVTLSRTPDLPNTAPENIKKEKINHIRGTWNLYKNIPVNTEDLWAESCFLKYQSLAHEADLDSEKIETLHEFAKEIEQYTILELLFQHLKRNACFRSLHLVRQPMKDRKENSLQKLPDSSETGSETNSETDSETDFETDFETGSEIGEKLVSVNKLFAEFLKKYPNEDNMKAVEIFLDTLDLFRSDFPDSGKLSESAELFRNIFIDVQKQVSDPVIREYAEIYEGILRRQELIGKPMPIWGADLTGKVLDEKLLNGKVVLLDFWATWCGPCVGEFPHLKKLYEKYHRNGFEIIGYNVDSDLKKLTVYLEQNPLPWTILSKETTAQMKLPSLSGYYGAKQLPVVLLRDQSGNAVLLDARGEKLNEILEKIFGK